MKHTLQSLRISLLVYRRNVILWKYNIYIGIKSHESIVHEYEKFILIR